MTTTRNFVDMVMAGKNAEAKEAFDVLVSEKVAPLLDVKRAEVASGMFEQTVAEELVHTHGNITIHRETDRHGSRVNVIKHKGKEVDRAYYDRDSDAFWINQGKGKGDKAFDTHADMAKHFAKIHG